MLFRSNCHGGARADAAGGPACTPQSRNSCVVQSRIEKSQLHGAWRVGACRFRRAALEASLKKENHRYDEKHENEILFHKNSCNMVVDKGVLKFE